MSKVIRCDRDGCGKAILLEEAGPGPNTYTLPDCGGVFTDAAGKVVMGMCRDACGPVAAYDAGGQADGDWVSLNPPGLTDGGPDFCSLECAAEWTRGALDAASPVKGVA